MLFLLDKSAHELARRDSRARQTFETLAVTGVLAARAHDAVLIHHDRDFDDIATVASELRTRWIIPPDRPGGP